MNGRNGRGVCTLRLFDERLWTHTNFVDEALIVVTGDDTLEKLEVTVLVVAEGVKHANLVDGLTRIDSSYKSALLFL